MYLRIGHSLIVRCCKTSEVLECGRKVKSGFNPSSPGERAFEDGLKFLGDVSSSTPAHTVFGTEC